MLVEKSASEKVRAENVSEFVTERFLSSAQIELVGAAGIGAPTRAEKKNVPPKDFSEKPRTNLPQRACK